MPDSGEIKTTLEKLKKDIDGAKTKMAEAKGQQKSILKRLLDEYGFKSIEEAEKALKKYQKDVGVLKDKMEKEYNKLVADYGWQ